MPLRKYLAERKQALAAVLADPKVRGVQLAADPEAWKMAAQLLVAIERTPQQPDRFVGVDLPASGDVVAGTAAALRAAAAAADVPVAPPPPAGRDALTGLCAQLLDAPVLAGARLFLVFGDHVHVEKPGFDAALADLTRRLDRRVVVIALDRRQGSRLAAFASISQVVRWEFALGPAEIEAGLRAASDDPAASPRERARHLAGLAGFAAARREFPEALRLGEAVRAFYAAERDASEEALAAFNLGTTHDRRSDFAAAQRAYEDALRLAIAASNSSLAQQILHNLGCAWGRQGRSDLAEAYLRGALQGADRLGNGFAACQALESLGVVLVGLARAHEAAQVWREASRRYATMDPAVAPMARAGQTQIEQRLRGLGREARG